MQLNFLGLYTKLLGLRAWSNSGAALKEQFRTSINLSLGHISMDVPNAFYPDKEHFVLFPDQTTAGTERYVQRTADEWVLSFVDSTGAVPTLPIPATDWTPTLDGTWEGIMHIEVQDEDGVWHRRHCREFWFVDNIGVSPTQRSFYVSLDRAFPSGSNSAVMEFRIYQPYIYLRDDALELVSAMVWDGNNLKMERLSAGSAESFGLVDFRGTDLGFPTQIINDDHLQLDAPNFVPTHTEGGVDTWVGPENMGTFTFLYTYVRGYRSNEWQEAPGRQINDPLWESGPSPVSAAFTNATDGSVILSLPDIDWMQNFGTSTDLRYTHSGWRKRIYVARTAVQAGPPGTHPNVESAGIYYLLDEVDGADTTYTWTGSVIPDYHRRFRHSTGYYAWRSWPHQDGRYEIDLHVSRKPADLEVDNDTPRIKPPAIPAFIELCLYYACLKDGVDMDSAMLHLNNYENKLKAVRAALANRAGTVAPQSWAGNVDFPRRNYDTYRIVP